MHEYIRELHNHPLFTGINEENMLSISACLGFYERKYKKGEIVFLSEEPVSSIGIIITGRVLMIKEYDNGEATTLINIEEGELFGETFACGSFTNSKVLFRAAMNSDILFIPFRRMLHTCDMTCTFHHKLIENMVRLMSDKNVRLMEKLEASSRKTLRDKIFTYLSNEAAKTDKNEFYIPLGRTELAEYLCADRSALTRELNNMKKDGLIDFEKNKFRIFYDN